MLRNEEKDKAETWGREESLENGKDKGGKIEIRERQTRRNLRKVEEEKAKTGVEKKAMKGRSGES